MKVLAKYFGVGLVTVLPFALVIWVIVGVFRIVNSWFGPWLNLIAHRNIPGAGFVLVIVLITLIGLVARLYISHRILTAMDALFNRIPLVKSLYSMFKEIINNLLGHQRRGFQRTVLVKWPDERATVIGFVTNEQLPPSIDPDGQRISVYIPNAFQLAGITAIIERDQTMPCNMSIEEAIKFTLSAGLGNAKEHTGVDTYDKKKHKKDRT